MKILMLNSYDEIGGAAKAAFRLNKELKSLGVDSQLLVQGKTSDEKDVLGPQNRLIKLAYSIRTVLGIIPVWLYQNKPTNNFSPAFMPDSLHGQIDNSMPDIVHLHWICAGFMRLETIKKIKQPIVWTLHDSWPFTGGCHMPYECIKYRDTCGFCPVLGSQREKDLSRWVWQRKFRAWQGLNLTLVTPSHWLANCARTSSLFSNARVTVIPNGLETETFHPLDKKSSRNLLGLPQDKNIILFGAAHANSDPNKGFHLLQGALQKLGRIFSDLLLVVFGSADIAPPPNLRVPMVSLGWIDDDHQLARIYSAANVFVAPSIQENLPNTVMEAMACGTPCVAFHQGGMPDLIDHELSGYLVQPYDIDGLAHGIAWVLENSDKAAMLSSQALSKVRKELSLELVARRYANLYNELLSDTAGGSYV